MNAHVIAAAAGAGLGLVNLAAFMAMAADKAAARDNQSRVRESTLLNLALLGGWPGIWAGMRAFRHKTRKEPFRSRFWTIAWIEGVAAFGLLLWWIATG